MPAEDITITAIWNVIDYTISYDFVDGYIDIDSIIEDFLNDYNTARGKSHTVESFYALGSWGEISDASLFLYNSTYKAKWAWLVNYIAEVAGSANKVAFETFFNYSSQAELNAANSNNIYRIAYELRGWVGQAKYTQNGNFHSADYSDSEVQNKLVNYYFAQTYNIESDTITIPELIKNGCQFIGWIDENGNQVASIQSGSTGNISLSAVYTYNFTLNTNDGTLPESYYEYVPTGDLVKSMTLSKYDNTGNASGIYFCDTSVTSMNSLRWQYKILLQADENGWYKVVAVDAATASVNSVATNAGVEWTHALASSETNISTYASVGNYLYLPSVSVGDSDISANIYDEMGLTKQLINFVYSVLTPHVLGNPTKEDYNFGGWYAESDFSGEKIDILQYQNANITLYAKWTIDPVEVELSEGDTQALNAILTKPTIVVNGQFNKGQYIVNEKVYTYGIDCFVSIADAVAAASEGDIIYVFSGTYADDLTISANDLTLVGPNYNIHGNDTRYTEANITGLTTINGANVTINGLKFSGNGAIKVGADNVTISHIHMSAKQVACNGNNRQGCIVDSANISDLSVLNSKIDAPNNGTDYSTYTNQYMSFSNVTNLTISGNYITNSGATTTSGSGSYSGMRIYTVGGKLNITNNEFRWATIGYVMYLAGYNSCTEINIIENIFDGTTAVPDSATITFRGSTAPIVIQGNEFYNFNGSTITFTSAATSNVIVRYNYFDENTLYKIGTSGSTSISYENNYYEATSQTTSTPDYGKVESYEELKELYRIWKLPSHNVSLNLNGGTVGQNLTTYKETIGATLPTPTKEGYSFVGWYDNAEFSGNSYSHISSTANTDLTFYAKWNLVNYTISYELDGGETINPDSYTIESENITLNAPTKEGYTFLGWTYDGQIEPTLSVTILKGSTGNRTYFANWEVNKYTIKYYDYDGTLLGTEEVNYGATISERENPTKDGYTFVEWTPAVPNTMPLNGIEVTAVYGMESESWELVTDASQLTVGDKVVIVANEYDYVLSTTQNDNNRGQTPGTKNATTIILGADAQIITLEEGAVAGTFAFNVGNGYLYAASNSSNYLRTEASLSDNSSWEITISDGVATIVAQGTYSRNTMQYNSTSSLFSCYDSASQKAISIYKATKEFVEVEFINVTYKTYDGSQTIDVIEAVKGSYVTLNDGTALNRDGFTFIGWSKDINATEASYENPWKYTFSENITLYEVWKENITVSFNINGGTGSIESITQMSGTNFKLPSISDITAPEGYQFISWKDEEGNEYYPEHEYVFTKNTILSAVWEEVSEGYQWELVANVNNLNVGDNIVIVATDSNYALSTTQNNNNRGQASVEKEGNVIRFGNDVQIITLEEGAVLGTFAFNVGNGYLYAASNSSNYLRTEASLSDNSSWEITISDGVATIVAQGTYSRNTMQYNSTSSLFSCYDSASQKAISIYKLICDHTFTEEAKEATCTEAGGINYTCTKCSYTYFEEDTPALGHNYIEEITTSATCVVAGEKTFTCSECSDSYTEVIPAIGHNYVDGVCSNCGESESASEPILSESLNVYASTGSLENEVITWEGTNFTFQNAKGNSSTAIRTSDTDHYRIYAKSGITIAVNDSYTLTKVVITATSTTYAEVLQTSIESAGYTATISGNVVTVTFAEGQKEMTFTASAQIRINTVEVFYK